MKRALVIATAAATIATPSLAQDPVLALNPTTMIGYADTTAAGEYAKQAFRTRAAPHRAHTASVPHAVDASRFAYRPSDAVRQRVYARAIARAKGATPSEAPKLAEALTSGRMASQSAAYLRRYGMSPNNLVDTTALNLAMSWFATRADASDPSPAQMAGLRSQVAETYARMPALINASDAAKQELSEANIIEAGLSSSLANAAASNPKLAAQTRTAVAQNVSQTYGIDLRQMTLTDKGLQ